MFPHNCYKLAHTYELLSLNIHLYLNEWKRPIKYSLYGYSIRFYLTLHSNHHNSTTGENGTNQHVLHLRLHFHSSIFHYHKTRIISLKLTNPFCAIGIFLYPLKSSENEKFSDVLRGFRKKPLAWNETLKKQKSAIFSQDHPFSTYAIFSENIFLVPLISVRINGK